MSEFVHRLRVRYNECDPQGIVFNGNYLTYVDVALVELWRDRLGSYDEMLDEHGVDLVVGSVTLDFRASARPDDVLDIGLEVAKLGTTSMTFAIHMRLGESTVVQGTIRHVCVDRTTMAKTPIPDTIRTKLAPVTAAG